MVLEPGQRRGRAASVISVRLPLLLLAVLLLLAAGSATAAVLLRNGSVAQDAPSHVTWFSGPASAAAEVRLRDQSGRLVDLRQLRGRAVALTFLTAACKEDCPLVGARLASADAALTDQQRRRTVYMAISVAPLDDARRGIIPDTPVEVAHFIKAANLARIAQQGRFLFLTGRHAALAPLWKAYHIGIIAPTPTGGVDHTSLIYLIDPAGALRGLLSFPFQTGDVTQALSTLLG